MEVDGMKVYLGNAFSTGMLTELLDKTEVVVRFKKLTVNDVKDILTNNEFMSIIGHESTAMVLETLLNIKVPVNRINVRLEKGDTIIVFQLKQRLPEGKVLDIDEIKMLDYDFILATVE
jgi:hypothetical protein